MLLSAQPVTPAAESSPRMTAVMDRAVSVIAIGLSLFQLYTAGLGAMTALVQRSVHLAAILGLTFLLFPPFSRARRDRLSPWLVLDLLLLAAAVACCVYVVVFLDQIYERQGQWQVLDVVVGARETRSDPLLDRIPAKIFWRVYRKFVFPEMPIGGIDVFGCNQAFRDQLLRLEESHSSLIAQIFWMGFRRKTVTYHRIARRHGKSGWSFRKKVNYLLDSIFSFTDLPIRILMIYGAIGTLFTLVLGAITLVVRTAGWIEVPGYATTILTVLFFGVLNIFGIGLVGSYAWRAYENTKRRPLAIVLNQTQFNGN